EYCFLAGRTHAAEFGGTGRHLPGGRTEHGGTRGGGYGSVGGRRGGSFLSGGDKSRSRENGCGKHKGFHRDTPSRQYGGLFSHSAPQRLIGGCGSAPPTFSATEAQRKFSSRDWNHGPSLPVS